MRCGDLMVSELITRLSGQNLNPGQGQMCCTALEQETLLPQCLSPPRCISELLVKKKKWVRVC